jgi:ferredoxin
MSFLLNWLESLSKEINVTKKCSREILHQATCLTCIDKCKQKAITIKSNAITIDSQNCTLCGVCVAACPLCALEGMGPQRTFVKEGLLYDESSPPSIKELLIYKKRGVQSIFVKDNSLSESLFQLIEETNDILQRLEEKPITVHQSLQEEKISRRFFFTTIQLEGKQLAKGLVPASWKLNSDAWDVRDYYPDFEFYSVDLDQSRCLLCQACFSICPEKVFGLNEAVLEITGNNCVNCRLCVDVCPEHAIEITPNIKKKKSSFLDYYSHVCQNCGQNFYSFQTNVERCYICKDRDRDWLSPY